MRLLHAAVVSRSEQQADRFFGDLLGLEQTRRSELSAELADRLFGLDQGCEIIYYGSEELGLELEVFVAGRPEIVERRLSHLCLEVVGRAELLERCAAMGFAVRQAPKGDYRVFFAEDGDGNLFEIKEKR